MSQVEVKRKQIQTFALLIGVIMLLVMEHLLENHGIAYFAVAVECFAVFAALLAEQVPDVLGRLLKSRRMKEQHQSASRMKGGVLALLSLFGIAGAALLIVTADSVAETLFHVKYAAFALRLLAPALLLRIWSSVLLGGFQGEGNQMPAAVSALLRQCLTLGFGLLLVPIFKRYGERVSLLLLDDRIPAMYGAAGLSMAVVISELLILIFLLVLCFGGGRKRKRDDGRESGRTESFSGAVGAFAVSYLPTMLSALFARLPVGLGILFCQRKAADAAEAAQETGAYYGGYLALCAVPVLLCAILLLPVAARAAMAVRKAVPRYSRDICGIGLHLGLVYAVFPAVFWTVMAQQLAQTFNPGGAEALTRFLQTGSALILESVLAAYFLRVLCYAGKQGAVLGFLAAFCAVCVIGLVIFVNALEAGAAGLVYAGLLGCGVLCILSGAFVLFWLKVRVDWLYGIVLPAGSGLLSGLVCLFLGRALAGHLGDVGALLICFVLGLILYLAPQLLLRGFRAPELKLMPGGGLLRKFLR